VSRVIDTEEAENTERISHRDTETQSHKETENLCVSVSPWLIYSVRSVNSRAEGM